MARYAPWLSFDVEHDFYPNGRSGGALAFVPAPRTAARLDAAGCIARATGTGIDVFHDTDRVAALRLNAADAGEPLRLAWLAIATEPEFVTVTAGLPAAAAGTVLFDDALAVDEGGGTWRLHREPVFGGAELLAAPWLLADGPGARRRFACFAVSLGIEPAAATAPDWTPSPRRFVLRLAARATVWKYILVGEWGTALPQVVDPSGEASFEAPRPETLDDGRTALAIVSTAPLPLQRRSRFRFQLRGRVGNGERILVKRLPVAGTRFFSPSRGGQGTRVGPPFLDRSETGGGAATLVSEIYLHR